MTEEQGHRVIRRIVKRNSVIREMHQGNVKTVMQIDRQTLKELFKGIVRHEESLRRSRVGHRQI